MSQPIPTHRVVAGLAVPLDLVPRIIEAIRAEYAEAVEPHPDDDDAAVQAALLQWVTETLAKHESAAARQPLAAAVAQTVADFETRAAEAKQRALDDANRILRSAPTDAVL